MESTLQTEGASLPNSIQHEMMSLQKIIPILLFPMFWLSKRCRGIYYLAYSEYVKRSIGLTENNVIVMPGSTIIGGKNISIGNKSFIGRYVILSAWASYKGHMLHPKITIGNNVSLGEWNHITAINEITIGDGVLTGRWVTITDNSHGNLIDEINERPSERALFSKGSVTIGSNVWIGDKATILPNVCIGEGSIIGANSVVTKDVPPYCVVAGNPAKIIKRLNGNSRKE